MSESNHVVAHLADGRLLKGTTVDFFPNRPSFHLLPTSGGSTLELYLSQMKALFFVKSLKGSALPRKPGFPATGANGRGKKVAIRFKDGEVLCGYSLTYLPGREGFFIHPADADSNNLRVYVVRSFAEEIKAGADAEAIIPPR